MQDEKDTGLAGSKFQDPRTGMQQLLNTGLSATCGGSFVVVCEMTLAQIEHVMSKFSKIISEVISKIENTSDTNVMEILECIPMATGSVREFIADTLLWKNSKGVCRNPELTAEDIGDCNQTETMDIVKKFIQVNPAARRLVGKSPALGRMFGLPEESKTDVPRA